MALQDLTPQLRTRLSRMERAVGWFVFLATSLLLFGFGYYVYHTAARKGWFVIKAKFHTFVQSSSGLNVGDPVFMMGFQVGQITSVHPMPPRDPHSVEVAFEIRDPFFRYIWSQGSLVKVNSADFLGKRQLEVTRATNGYAICVTQPVAVKTVAELKRLVAAEPDHWQLYQDVFDAKSNLVFGAYTMLDATNLQRIAELNVDPVYAYDNTVNRKRIVASWHPRLHRYENFTPDKDVAWLRADESPAVTERLEKVVAQVEQALPNFFALTNQLIAALNNSVGLTSNLNAVAESAKPAAANLADISGQLKGPGALGSWLLSPGMHAQLEATLTNANSLTANADTNLVLLAQSLDNLANITSNLNAQVQANTNMLKSLSDAVVHADEFVQGLKHHWLLRSAFKTPPPPRTNQPPARLRSPRDMENQ